jgi:tRNA(Ile)-lysidine synthetase-like protein
MINTFRTLPRHVGIAFSGGCDSVAMFHIARSLGREITLFTYDHGTATSREEIEFAEMTAAKYAVPLVTHADHLSAPQGDSRERWWSERRNAWLQAAPVPIVTGHHLNDCAEWYLMTALTGQGGFIMNYANNNICRPLITTPRSVIEQYVADNKFEHITDPTNSDITFNKRNRVRAQLLPAVLEVNPGFLNTIKRRIIQRES